MGRLAGADAPSARTTAAHSVSLTLVLPDAEPVTPITRAPGCNRARAARPNVFERALAYRRTRTCGPAHRSAFAPARPPAPLRHRLVERHGRCPSLCVPGHRDEQVTVARPRGCQNVTPVGRECPPTPPRRTPPRSRPSAPQRRHRTCILARDRDIVERVAPHVADDLPGLVPLARDQHRYHSAPAPRQAHSPDRVAPIADFDRAPSIDQPSSTAISCARIVARVLVCGDYRRSRSPDRLRMCRRCGSHRAHACPGRGRPRRRTTRISLPPAYAAAARCIAAYQSVGRMRVVDIHRPARLPRVDQRAL